MELDGTFPGEEEEREEDRDEPIPPRERAPQLEHRELLADRVVAGRLPRVEKVVLRYVPVNEDLGRGALLLAESLAELLDAEAPPGVRFGFAERADELE